MKSLLIAIRFECMYMLTNVGMALPDDESVRRHAWLLSMWQRIDNYIADHRL